MREVLFADFRIFLIFLFLSIFLIIADSFKLLTLPKTGLQFITVPIQYGFYRTGINVSRQFEFIFLARNAAKENKALNEQLAQVLSENANLRKKLSEAETFLAQQNSLSPQTFNLVAARLSGFSDARYLLIDKGSSNNLKVGQPVIYKDNYIGRIAEVAPKLSKIILPSDPDSKISSFVSSSEGRAKGILRGKFGSEMLLDNIAHDEPAKVKDLVYSEGAEGVLPRGLILGQVTQVMERPNELFKQALVKPVFDSANLEIVFVITN